MKENLLLLLFALLSVAMIIALICSAVNNISQLISRIKENRKHKKEKAKFQKLQAQKEKELAELTTQTVSKHLYGSNYGYLFSKTIISAIHIFNDPKHVLRPNGCPFNNVQNLKLLLSAVHPDSRFPSKGYPLYMEKCNFDERTQRFKAWFAPYHGTINGFVVQKVNESTVLLLHGRYGTLCLPIPYRRKLRKGDSVKVLQNSQSTDSGYLVSYHID